MITMFTLGTPKAVFAGVAVLVAHAVFKAALFMVVGEVDVRTGTRDIHQLSGLARSMPLAAAVAVVSGASMAGAPPLLGFPAKEAAIEAVLGADGAEGVVATVIVVAGSVLTVAYTVRFLVGVFGPAGAPTQVAPGRWALVAPSVVLGVGSLVGFVALGSVTDAVRSAAVEIDPGAEVYSLLRWPGLTTAFVTSVLILAGGVVLGLALSRRAAGAPRALGAELADRAVDGVLVLARRLTARVQHGSLPVYVATMAFVAALAAVPFATSIDPDAIEAWDRPLQAVLGAMVVAAAIAAAVVGSRLGAALGLGGVGFGVAALFVVQGAPDLAITQLLVETVVVVGFVVALGHLTRRFPPVGQIWRGIRLGVALLAGTAVVTALLSAASAPTGQAPVEELIERSVDDGGGNNVVNVILTDVRALDTLGEVIVLMVVAIGILALAAAGRRETEGSDRPADHGEVAA
jgi:multicomponent Na+:H+ antiporter subunit A